MDNKKILIINLSKGRVGETNANLLGSMIITKLYLGALSRADASESKLKALPPFYLYVDEFQSFANESFADILSEARKYKLSLTIAHQYVEQMSEEVRAAVFGNVGTMIAFRVGAFDAELLEKEFSPVFTAEDVVNLGFAQIYLKLMIDGVSSQPFSATTLPPIKKQDINYRDDIVEHSRKAFAAPKAEVEEAIRKWHDPVVAERKESKDSRDSRDSKSDTRDSASSSTSASKSSANQIQTSSKIGESAPKQATTPTPPAAQAPTQTPALGPAPAPVSTPAITAAPSPTPKPLPVATPVATSAHAAPVQKTAPTPPPQKTLTPTKAAAPTPTPNLASSPVPQNVKPVSLESLKKPQSKGPTAQNLSQLKDALKDIVDKAKKEAASKAEVKPNEVRSNTVQSSIHTPHKKPEVKPQPVSEPKVEIKETREPKESKETKEKIKEVPEDVLRRILDIKKR